VLALECWLEAHNLRSEHWWGSGWASKGTIVTGAPHPQVACAIEGCSMPNEQHTRIRAGMMQENDLKLKTIFTAAQSVPSKRAMGTGASTGTCS